MAWRAPPSSTVHGQITGYRIEYGLTGRRKKSVTTDAETLVSFGLCLCQQVLLCLLKVS